MVIENESLLNLLKEDTHKKQKNKNENLLLHSIPQESLIEKGNFNTCTIFFVRIELLKPELPLALCNYTFTQG